MRRASSLSTVLLLMCGMSASTQTSHAPHSFELLTHRMDVDVDGAPRAYGPPGSDALDYLRNAHAMGRLDAPIVGYLLEDAPPHHPVVQGPEDPAPGYYVSQTAFEDESVENQRDPRRYVDATKINYVVLGASGAQDGSAARRLRRGLLDADAPLGLRHRWRCRESLRRRGLAAPAAGARLSASTMARTMRLKTRRSSSASIQGPIRNTGSSVHRVRWIRPRSRLASAASSVKRDKSR